MEIGSPGHVVVLIILWLAWLGLRSIIRSVKNGVSNILNKEI